MGLGVGIKLQQRQSVAMSVFPDERDNLDMGWKEFAASVIGDLLSWPVTVLVIVLLFLKPIRKLIGRVKGAKGFGAEVKFSEEIKNVEDKVDEVLDEERELGNCGAQTADSPSVETLDSIILNKTGESVMPDPAQDPSGAILVSWEKLSKALDDLARTGTGQVIFPRQYSVPVINKLYSSRLISGSFYESVMGLRNIRNKVAHGQVNPTSGVARTYVERAGQLNSVVQETIADRNKVSDGSKVDSGS
ncbi:MAG: hypothetical protein ABF792_04270 [Bifidobacterium psychraerophilum]|uniref:hypothetical protein n=1 Tax=Bifidobacterium psychraerophilum TaxID=218140 RepID=UPI0039E771E0